jgi:hypothetical protein
MSEASTHDRVTATIPRPGHDLDGLGLTFLLC